MIETLNVLFIEPWQYGSWMWRAVVSGLLVSIPCAVLGCFLYLRRMSMLVDAISHVALPGIVAAFLVVGRIEGFAMLAGATIAGLIASMLIATLQRIPTVKNDAAIGIVFTSMFALGVIALTVFVKGAHLDLQCVLFGDILGISDSSLMTLSIVGPVTLVLIGIFWRWLSITSFDPGYAAAIGIPVVALHYGIMIVTSMSTVAGFEAVGSILVIAFVVTPAATAHKLTDRLSTMIAVAAAHAVVSTLIGVYISIWWNFSTTGTIVVVGMLIYLLTFVFAPKYGMVKGFWGNRGIESWQGEAIGEGGVERSLELGSK